jgi:hypothetical protein
MTEGTSSAANATSCARPPRWYWGLPAIIAFLRTLPFLCQRLSSPPEGFEYVGVSFIPKDFLSYLAFIRQVRDNASLLFYNPFTTVPQTPSFVLLFHWALGAVASVFGIPPNWAFELSRIPLLFVFFWLLWRFLTPWIPARRTRCWASLLIGFSGGLECFVLPITSLLPPSISAVFRQEAWDMYGWSTFAGFFNPLWITSMILGLWLLPLILGTQGPLRRRELAQVLAGFVLAYFVHPYFAVFLAALGGTRPVLGWLLRGDKVSKPPGPLLATLVIALLACVAAGQWQAMDPVYRNSSAGIFGTQNVSVFWWPVTLGVVGLLSLRGLAHWWESGHPWREPMAVWVLTVILLMTSPIINGYKFVFLIHLPLCILAAEPLGVIVDHLIAKTRATRWVSLLLLTVLLFASPIYLTVRSVRAAKEDSLVPAAYLEIVRELAGLPTGNVLAPADLGNIIPAYTSDRVWVGQWFLTPYYKDKSTAYQALVSSPTVSGTLDSIIADGQILYVVVPSANAAWLIEHFGPRIGRRSDHGNWVLLVLK